MKLPIGRSDYQILKEENEYYIDKTKFKEALNLMRHRGDDDSNIVEFNNYLFGFQHLAIENLNNNTQPLCRDGVLIVFNGEIYNYKELNKKFGFDSTSDTKTLILMYEKFKEKMLFYLRGMFAFCIYDKKEDKFFCARDRVGEKPFYYHLSDKFIFASEIKALLEFVPKKLNLKAVSEFFMYNSSLAVNTMFEGIYKLPAGCYYDGEIKKWHDFERVEKEYSAEDAVKITEKLLRNSIEKRVMGEVEIGSLLSGGVDSSLIVALAKEYKKIDTFSIGYEGFDNYDERKYAKEVAKYLGVKNFDFVLNKRKFFDNFEYVLDFIFCSR